MKQQDRQVAALYVRVSSMEQAEHGHSLQAQTDALKKHIHQAGFRFHRSYKDAGIGGKDLDRPAMQSMLSDAYNGKLSEIFVWRLDRLTRSTLDLLELVEFFKAFDIGLTSITEPHFDYTTPSGECMLTMMGSFAQMERKVMQERIQLGMQKRREQHKWSGTAPYGYRYDPEKENLVIDAEEASIVRKMFKQYLKLGSMSAIENHLNEQDIAPRVSDKWASSSVGAILSNQVYTGKLKVGDTEWTDRSLRIVPDRLFQDCQMLRSSRRKYSPKLKATPRTYDEGCFCHHCGRHCLDGMTFCPGCGSMVKVGA